MNLEYTGRKVTKLAYRFLTTPADIYHSLVTHRLILCQLIRRDILARYRKSYLGILWALLTPMLTFVVYFYVFSNILRVRFTSPVPNINYNYGIILFSGIMLHLFLTEVLNRSPVLVLENVNFVKKVVFPLEILSLVAIGSAMVPLSLNYLILVGAIFLFNGTVQPTIILVPLVWIPFFAVVAGISWVLSSLGVFLRDIVHVVGLFSTLLLFGSTILFPANNLPNFLKILILFNPLSVPVHATRNLALWGLIPNLNYLTIYTGFAIIFLWFSAFWFTRTKRGFADVI
ncbi:ABC polysaccharide efflux pump, inner membrane subunit [Candidatus Endolissoclinum faulkneri L5]|uniref:Transport permease protein n=1 Tax=Candidatus Endolissoclinum faulkneri L5 TaxID=1401328 RepID=V9TS07_9PROT|nr:ABC transporter permease [Candidatus Endolissoclinum faulkneri]AHC73356.1 ABC polysaccharide efflux pump, inner membrane subunit [Candidatus Endolissoclinum faulkneri L5]